MNNKNDFDFSHFSSFEVDGNKRPMSEFKRYVEESKEKNIEVKEKLKIGDKVALKNRDYVVVITGVDYEIDGVGKTDYIGRREDNKNNYIYFFNQREITKIISRAVEKESNQR